MSFVCHIRDLRKKHMPKLEENWWKHVFFPPVPPSFPLSYVLHFLSSLPCSPGRELLNVGVPSKVGGGAAKHFWYTLSHETCLVATFLVLFVSTEMSI